MRQDLKNLLEDYSLYSSLRTVSHIVRHKYEQHQSSTIFMIIWASFLAVMVIVTGTCYCILIQKFISWETAEMVMTRFRPIAFPSITLCEVGLGKTNSSFNQQLRINCRMANFSFYDKNRVCNHLFSVKQLKRARHCRMFTATTKITATNIVWVSFDLQLKSNWVSHVQIKVDPGEDILEQNFLESTDGLSGFGVRMILHDWNTFPYARAPEFMNLLLDARNLVTITETRRFIRLSWPYNNCVSPDSRVVVVENQTFKYTEEACRFARKENLEKFCPIPCIRKKHSLTISYLNRQAFKQRRSEVYRLIVDVSRFNRIINEYYELPLMDTYSFLAKFGGIGGMFLGLTTVAVMEVVYLLLRICVLFGKDAVTQHETIDLRDLSRNHYASESECSIVTILSAVTEKEERSLSFRERDGSQSQ